MTRWFSSRGEGVVPSRQRDDSWEEELSGLRASQARGGVGDRARQ